MYDLQASFELTLKTERRIREDLRGFASSNACVGGEVDSLSIGELKKRYRQDNDRKTGYLSFNPSRRWRNMWPLADLPRLSSTTVFMVRLTMPKNKPSIFQQDVIRRRKPCGSFPPHVASSQAKSPPNVDGQ
ncbi:hypothetical protein KPH14_004544 [Odynerus spinipes]|uniref:Uncharacterized protein n=1 Tax=Odynerus spinipes TaxID=1348599 RepID=A0AAD9RLZ0_9HYME|nr:hypothetical protein KPH14_004544 [Odynerus spinipes]